MANAIIITIPWDPQRLSPNQRLHWAERAKRTKIARDLALWEWAINKRPKVDGPVEVSILVRRPRVIDPDNAQAGLKGIIDGLFNANRNRGDGITPDDSSTYVRWLPVQFETGKEWKGNEQVVLTITPLETT